MENSDSMRFNAINLCQKLPVDSSNTKHTRNHVNDAQIMRFDYGKNKQTVSLFLTVSVALRLGLDCNRFLTLPATYLNHYNALNWLGMWKTVFKFS